MTGPREVAEGWMPIRFAKDHRMLRSEDFTHLGRGILMGGADVVPGVSGGTVALILGIYDRLVRAISRFDGTFLHHVRRGEWKRAAAHVDLRFLAALGTGIGLGILGLASLMHYLLEDQEYIAIHSLDRNSGIVKLNVGTASGGVEPGTLLTVYRREKPGSAFQQIGQLRLQRYLEDVPERAAPRLAAAKPVDGLALARLKVSDVVSQPSQRRPFTLAAFFGLILGSTVLVGRMMERWTPGAVLTAVAGAALAYWLVGRFPIAPYEGRWYLFVCGLLAICAMILPGISGAFILLVLGVYSEVTGLLRSVLARSASPDVFLSIVVFVSGCVIGLLSFSKLLNWLLGRYRPVTMACLCGFMAGSLRKIWPFKHDLSPDQARYRFKLFENVWPRQFDETVWGIFGTMLAAAAVVFLLDWLTAGHEHAPHLEENATPPESPRDATGGP